MALPGLHGTDHIGITVPDIAEAHRFLVEVIGYEHAYSLPARSDDGDWMEVHLNVDPRAVIREVRFYRCGFGSNLEVFQYETPDAQAPPPRNSDLGGHHLAYYVDEIEVAIDYLVGRGIRVLGQPTASGSASAGQRFVYFLTPWGMQMELVTFPSGKAYEKGAHTLLWHPARPSA